MQHINFFQRHTIWMLLLCVMYMMQCGLALAETQRFVRPEHVTTYVDPLSKSELKVLIDQHLGGTKDLTLAHIIIPPGVAVPGHVHQSTEIIYILSGALQQLSDGETQTLTAGMTVLVPAKTTTTHTVTSQEPVHALIIWVPGGEEKGLASRWQATAPSASPGQ